MKKIVTIFMGMFLLLGATSSFAGSQNLQLFSMKNTDGAITAKTVQKAFDSVGLIVDVNNDMNSIFSKRYGKVYHKKYNLAIFHNDTMIKKLLEKYPRVGMMIPQQMSIYQADDNTINISTLSLAGMSRLTQIPQTDPDLVAYAKLLDKALHKALPKGKFQTVQHSTNDLGDAFITDFEMEMELEDGTSYVEAKESFEEEFEGEISPVGFLVPKSYKLQEEVVKGSVYDFYDTYSIIRFNAIYPVYQKHPDAGAYAPFSLTIYKKKGEDNVHIVYPSITNWNADLDIKDAKTKEAVTQTQELMTTVLSELTE